MQTERRGRSAPGSAAVAVVGGIGLLAPDPGAPPDPRDPAGDPRRVRRRHPLRRGDGGIKNELLDPNEPDPLKRAAGLFTWQLIVLPRFQSQQSDRDYEAISYAVMDQKDYLNISCEVNVDSVEVFFDAVDDRLIAFVDALIAFEMIQEFQGKAFVGYASLRFTGPTRALDRHAEVTT